MVESEQLISLVYDRTPLWDITSKSYHNRDVTRKLWQEIAQELNSTSEVAKGKWRNLRDNFRREHAKMSKKPTGSGAVDNTQLTSWKYYKHLFFLADVFSPRIMKTNIPPVSNQASEPADVTNEEEEDNVMPPGYLIDRDLDGNNTSGETQEAEVVVSAAQKDLPSGKSAMHFKKPNIQMKQKRVKSDAINELIVLEKRKIEQFEKMHESKKTCEELEKDEDYCFLMSLLPHLRDIPKRRKLATRIRLQQVLIDEDRTEEVRSPNSSGSSYGYNYTTPMQLSPNDALRSYVGL